jgi:hypothetical protein
VLRAFVLFPLKNDFSGGCSDGNLSVDHNPCVRHASSAFLDLLLLIQKNLNENCGRSSLLTSWNACLKFCTATERHRLFAPFKLGRPAMGKKRRVRLLNERGVVNVMDGRELSPKLWFPEFEVRPRVYKRFMTFVDSLFTLLHFPILVLIHAIFYINSKS